jgi:PhnB protein
VSVKPIPEGFHTITPNTVIDGAAKAIEFYKEAFGAEERMRLMMPGGTVAHAELQIGDCRLNLADAMEGWPPHKLLAQIYVPNSDAFFDRAVAAGAKVISPMADMFFGSREGRIEDPFGNTWTISTRIADLSVEEMQQRINASAAG